MSKAQPHPRELAREQCFPKPGIGAGPKGETDPVLEVYPRTDLFFCIVDHRRPWHDETVFITQYRGLHTGGDGFRDVRFALERMAETEGFSLIVSGVL